MYLLFFLVLCVFDPRQIQIYNRLVEFFVLVFVGSVMGGGEGKGNGREVGGVRKRRRGREKKKERDSKLKFSRTRMWQLRI